MEKVLCLAALAVLLYCANAQRYNTFQQQPQSQYQRGPDNYNSQGPAANPPPRGSCKENNARYPVSGQCDAYIECRDGVPEEKLCPDGLLFNVNASVFSYPCGYPVDVSCEGRGATQRSEPTEECPHQYGYFRHSPNPAECGKFTNCVAGKAYTFDCPEGLAFSVDTYRCDWPDLVPDCDAERFLGFTCPEVRIDPFFGQQADYNFYSSPVDCQRYYMCINNRPRLFNCGEGYAFNEYINACDGVENVTTCSPEVYQRIAAAKAQREANLIDDRPLINIRGRL